MRTQKLLAALIGLLALAALGACYGDEPITLPKTVELTVTARWDESAEPPLTIDMEEHETATIFPGDRLAWRCDCPEGVEFAVRNIRHLADLDKAADLFHGIAAQGEVKALREAFWSKVPMTEEEADASAGAEPAATPAADMMNRVEALLTELARPRAEDPGPPFEAEVPRGFVPGTDSIESPPYLRIRGNHLWKFDWVVRKGELEVVWDPHFSGHSRKK